MVRWLTRYIEENKLSFERIQEEEIEINNLYEEWLTKDRETLIMELMAKKETEKDLERQEVKRKKKARSRRKMWKEWKNEEKQRAKEWNIYSIKARIL